MRLLCLLLCLALVAPAWAQEAEGGEGGELFKNGEFAEAEADGVPTGWQRRSKDTGFVNTHTGEDPAYVEIGVENAGEDSFIQQIAELPSDARKVTISARYRHEGIEKGEKGHMTGFIQGRFTENGKDFGPWIDLAKPVGTSEGDEWKEAKKTATVPAKANGLMLRLGMYGVKAGRLEVAGVTTEIVTEADLLVERAKYRPAEPYGEPVSDARYGRLMRGININNWFCQPFNAKSNGQKGGFTAEHFRAYVTGHDLSMLRGAGFDHVRLAVDPQFLMDVATGGLKTELLPELDRAIALILEHDLAVIVDVHPKMPSFKKFANKTGFPDAFVTWWGHFAKHLSATDPERVFLELMNEPGGQGYWTSNWAPYQDRLIMKVRENAPEHTLIANPGGYMLYKEIVKHEPHPDRNVIYAMHYYEPSPFTHSGAVWMKDWYRPLRNVPWPLTAETLPEAQANVDEKDKAAEKAKQALAGIAKENWGNPESITEHMGNMAAWAKQNDRRLVIGEWGVYTKYASREHRLRYLDFMTKEMAKHGIGWSKWEYCDAGFPIVENPGAPSADRRLDAEVIEALNLSQSVAARE